MSAIVKKTGDIKTYHFYRCSHSRKVHPTLKGMNVKEEDIWLQLESAVKNVSIGNSLAEQIEAYRASLKKLELMLNEEGYKRHIDRVREELAHYTTLIAQVNEAVSDALNETVESLIELAYNAKELWKSGTFEQRFCSSLKLFVRTRD